MPLPAAGTRSSMARGGLVRPRQGRWIAGVCAGIADRFGVSRLLVRLAFVASIILPGPQIVVYVVLWVLIPSELEEDERREAGAGSAR